MSRRNRIFLRVESGLVSGSGEFTANVTKVKLDLTEEFAVGAIDEMFGHPTGGGLGSREKASGEIVDAGLAFGVCHGWTPGGKSW